MTEKLQRDRWRSKMLQTRWPWRWQPIRPADVSDGLRSVMFARENILEDVFYHKIVPNRYVIEINEENYERNFSTIQRQIIQQWSQRVLEQLAKTNRRLGRQEYAFGGAVQIEIRPAADLKANQARILFQVWTEESAEKSGLSPDSACLELTSSRQRWDLRPGITTIGRYEVCDIHLRMPEIQEKRLVSGQHAYILSEGGQYRLFDGSPSGRPSANGTYINQERVPPGGHLLRDGDLILLAAAAPGAPRPGLPGTATFTFYQNCGP